MLVVHQPAVKIGDIFKTNQYERENRHAAMIYVICRLMWYIGFISYWFVILILPPTPPRAIRFVMVRISRLRSRKNEKDTMARVDLGILLIWHSHTNKHIPRPLQSFCENWPPSYIGKRLIGHHYYVGTNILLIISTAFSPKIYPPYIKIITLRNILWI